jgi:hypothetical protein
VRIEKKEIGTIAELQWHAETGRWRSSAESMRPTAEPWMFRSV